MKDKAGDPSVASVDVDFVKCLERASPTTPVLYLRFMRNVRSSSHERE